MTENLFRKESEVTFKIISQHIKKLEPCVKLLRRIYGVDNTTVSSIQKKIGENHFYVYVNVMSPSKGKGGNSDV